MHISDPPYSPAIAAGFFQLYLWRFDSFEKHCIFRVADTQEPSAICRSDVTVTLDTGQEAESVVISIRDTGYGFSEGEAGQATLAAQVRPSSAVRSTDESIELQATKAPSAASWSASLETPWGMVLALLLFLSLFGNLFQFYRHRVFVGTVGNELQAAFNNIAWSLERCLRKKQDLDARSTQKVTDPVLLREFREFALESEFMLRTLREQLGTVARNLRHQDRRAKSYPAEAPPEGVATAEKPLSQDSESRTA